jgi:catechol 2,3-dioxygenase-like lactoylglutathione lyase family enzyme
MVDMSATLQKAQPVLMVRDVTASIRFFERLGFTLAFEDVPGDPKYAGVRRDAVELHLQWHDAEEWNHPVDRPTYRFVVDDVDALSKEFDALHGLDRTPVGDTAWGTREFHVRDPDGNGLQFHRPLRQERR